ncbi:MAG: PASTA domain-containing protein [Gemmatimonadales bacterium]|nr:PASTA domain-containing protein [Gemmatimonadales bacterium]MYC88901.1 PASTA domain-containing protein [Candidatus Palauibacter denitrificans]
MRLLRLVLLFAAMFGIGYAFAAIRLFPAAEDPTDVDFTEIPDLTGVSLAGAGERLSALGLVSTEQGRLHHGEIPVGGVVAQRPLPGQLARAGDTIVLTTSAGIETRLVPDLAGLPGREAAALLTRLGFEIEIEETDESAVTGAIRTEPPAGSSLPLPARVRLFVSQGKAIVSVPDLHGRHVDDLDLILEEVELRLGAVRYQAEAPEVQGRVIFQSPDPGAALRGDGFVSVIVAGTPPDSAAADPGRDAVRDTVPPTPGNRQAPGDG